MARGWESKNVEEQQAERERGATADKAAPIDVARATRRKTLELALARMTADRQAAGSDAHRRMLDAAIADLDRQLREL